MRKWFVGVLFMLLFADSQAQEAANDLLCWATRRLTVEDFFIKKTSDGLAKGDATLSLDYAGNSLIYLKKGLNSRVKNIMDRSTSWIDTTQNVDVFLRYQQMRFDITEVFARKLRKYLHKNHEHLNKDYCVQLRRKLLVQLKMKELKYSVETNFGLDDEKQKHWELEIRKELNELMEYEYREIQ